MPDSSAEVPILEARNLGKSFGDLTVLDHVSLAIQRHEAVSIIGVSGSGKSTLLRCFNRLEAPSSGDVLFEGESILSRKTDINAVRSKIGFVFQSFNLYQHLSALDNVALALRWVRGLKRREAAALAEEQLVKVGLGDKLRQYPGQLSGGSSSASASRALSPWSPRSSCSTNQHRPSIRNSSARC